LARKETWETWFGEIFGLQGFELCSKLSKGLTAKRQSGFIVFSAWCCVQSSAKYRSAQRQKEIREKEGLSIQLESSCPALSKFHDF